MVKKLLPHLGVLLVFVTISVAYFHPAVFSGKTLNQHDTIQGKGAAKEIRDNREATGEEPLWTNSMFSGMPTFGISFISDGNWFRQVNKLVSLYLKGPVSILFTLLAGFYILLLTLKCDYKLAFIGALAFAFSSYFIIIIGAGHNTKARAIAYFPVVISGVLYAYRKNVYKGAILTAFALALQIYVNHIQITYYLVITLLVLGLVEAWKAYGEKKLPQFVKASAVLVVAGLLGAAPNYTRLAITSEYVKESIRGGKSELSPLGVKDKQDCADHDKAKDYAQAWSYGVLESFSMLIPKVQGGASAEKLGTGSNYYETLVDMRVPKKRAKQSAESVPTYWGSQSSTAGPTYLGAAAIFLFVLGMFIVKDKLKWWLLGIVIIAIPMAWGENFHALNDFLYYNLPLFSKFRTPAMILVIVEFAVPLLAILAIRDIINGKVEKEKILASANKSLYIVGGICAFFALLGPSMFDFDRKMSQFNPSTCEEVQFNYDDNLIANYANAGFGEANAIKVVQAIKDDRAAMMRNDAMISLVIVLAAFGLIMYYEKGKIQTSAFIGAIGALIAVDLIRVDWNYVNTDDFLSAKDYKNIFKPNVADEAILADEEKDFRVWNLFTDTYNDALTSYHHNHVGGYSPVKLIRYQDFIERSIPRSNTPNFKMLGMLNTKYIIQSTKEGPVSRRIENYGNAWFVKELQWTENADDEMLALSVIDPKTQAVTDNRFQDVYESWDFKYDSLASIELVEKKPRIVEYKYSATSPQLAVFSEVYYRGNEDWKAYVDGEYVPHFRLNYILRGMRLPAGDHKVKFEFSPPTYVTGETISLSASIVLILLALGAVLVFFKEQKEARESTNEAVKE